MTISNDNRIQSVEVQTCQDSISTSRSTPYLAAKAEGDNRMAIKRRLSEDAYGKALQDLSDMVKAELLESQYPVIQSHISRLQHIQCGTTSITIVISKLGKLPVGGRWGTTPLKDTNKIPKSLYRLITGNAGWPTGRESYGHGASVVVRGWESHLHGEGRQVSTILAWGGTRDA